MALKKSVKSEAVDKNVKKLVSGGTPKKVATAIAAKSRMEGSNLRTDPPRQPTERYVGLMAGSSALPLPGLAPVGATGMATRGLHPSGGPVPRQSWPSSCISFQ
jgi:hypothetical protein